MDSVKITSGGADLLCSGNLITLGLGETRLDIKHNGEQITLVCDFVDDDADVDSERIFEVIDETMGKFTFHNYKNASGTYTVEPMSLGTIGGRDLLFQYKIDALQTHSKMFFYTFYLGPEVKNG